MLNQNQLAELFDTFVLNVAICVKNILQNNELDENSVINHWLITAANSNVKIVQAAWKLF